MKTILYATDLNENEASVLKYAHALSLNLGAKLVVFHTEQLPPVRTVSRPVDQVKKMIINEQKEIVKAYCKQHLGDKTNNIIADVVVNDDILDAILKKSKSLQPYLVVIGKKEKYTKRGLLASDIGLDLLKKLTNPILIVPNKVHLGPVKTILYATDFENGDILAIKKIVPTAEENKAATIHVVHVSTKTEYAGKEKMEDFKKRLAEQISYKNIEFEVLFSENIEKELNAHAKRIDANIIVLLEREEKGFFQKLFTKSIAEKLEVKIDIPLMSFNEPSAK